MCPAPWAAQGSVSVTMVSGGVLRDHGGSGSLYPVGTGGYPACYHCGVASAQCGGIGSPGAVVPAVPGDAVGVFPPRCTTPTMVAW